MVKIVLRVTTVTFFILKKKSNIVKWLVTVHNLKKIVSFKKYKICADIFCVLILEYLEQKRQVVPTC